MTSVTRGDKFLILIEYARHLWTLDQTRTFTQLADWLNARGITTSYGTPYIGGRGVAALVRAAYNFAYYEMSLGDEGAHPITRAFTDQNGNFAYE
jgi:hypothetical protein